VKSGGCTLSRLKGRIALLASFTYFLTLKTAAGPSSEMLLSTYQTLRHHIPEDINLVHNSYNTNLTHQIQ
jgi:hypothetical protein